MSDILSRWLNERLGLSKKITDFEVQMSNGYLLGEILQHHGVLADFDKFVDRVTPEAKINNFTRLQPAMRSLNIKFDSNIANGIMTEKPGAAARLLQQLKMTLDMGQGAELTVSKKAPVSLILQTDRTSQKPLYKKADELLFEKTLRQKTENPKDYRLSMHLKKFTDEQVRQQNDVERFKLEERQREYDDIESLRKSNSQRIADKKAESSDISKKNRATHKHALELRKNREKADLAMELAFEEKHSRTIQLDNATNAHEVTKGIDVFEESLRRLVNSNDKALLGPPPPTVTAVTATTTSNIAAGDDGGGGNATMSDAEFMRSLAKKVPKDVELRAEAELYMSKVREKREQEELARKERERRRRRVMVDQQKTQADMEQKRREDMLVQKLLKSSEEERRVADLLLATMEEKEMIRQNRLHREEQYKLQRNKDYEFALAKDAELFKAAREEYLHSLEIERLRMVERDAVKQAERFQKHSNMCRGVVDDIIDVATKVAQYRELSNGAAMTPMEWREMMVMFVKGSKLYPQQSSSQQQQQQQQEEDDVESASLTGLEAEQLKVLNQVALTEYLAARGEWKDGSDPFGDCGGVNPILGTALKDIEKTLQPEAVAPEKPDIPSFAYSVAIIGPPFSGKSKQSFALAEELNLKVLEPSSLLKGSIEAFSTEKAAGAGDLSALAEIGARASECASNGLEVTDDIIVDVLVNAIKSLVPLDPAVFAERKGKGGAANKDSGKGKAAAAPAGANEVCGWVIDGWPCNKQQSKQLEGALTGFIEVLPIPVDQLPPPSLLAPRPPDVVDENEKFESGFNVVVRLLVDDGVSSQRALGRALDPVTGVVYHMEFDPPPAKDKAIRSRLQFFDKEGAEAAQLTERCRVYAEQLEEHDGFLDKFCHPCRVDGNGSIEATFGLLNEAVQKRYKELHEAKAVEGGHEQQQQHRDSNNATPASMDGDHHHQQQQQQDVEGGEQHEQHHQQQEHDQQQQQQEHEQQQQQEPKLELKPIHAEVAQLLKAQWTHAEEEFSASCKKSLHQIREEHADILNYLARTRKDFVQLLSSPDDKQTPFDEFVKSFNALTMEFRSRSETKAELHMQVDELRDTLWNMSDEARHAAEVERQAIMGSGWIDDHVRVLGIAFLRLGQADVERYQQTCLVLKDYYSVRAGFDMSTNVPESVNIITNGIAALSGKQVVEDPKKGGGKPADKKKDDKKGGAVAEAVEVETIPGIKSADQKIVNTIVGCLHEAKSRLGLDSNTTNPDHPLEESVEEYREAMAIERNAMLRRIGKLEQRLVELIVNFRDREARMLQHMDDLIAHRFKKEMEAISGVVKCLKDSVERDEKITYQLRLHGPEFVLDESIMLTPPPSPPPIVDIEALQPHQLNGDQLLGFVDLLYGLSASGDVDLSYLVESVQRWCSQSPGSMLPQKWSQIGKDKLKEALSVLDGRNLGIVDWKAVVVSLCLEDRQISLEMLRGLWKDLESSENGNDHDEKLKEFWNKICEQGDVVVMEGSSKRLHSKLLGSSLMGIMKKTFDGNWRQMLMHLCNCEDQWEGVNKAVKLVTKEEEEEKKLKFSVFVDLVRGGMKASSFDGDVYGDEYLKKVFSEMKKENLEEEVMVSFDDLAKDERAVALIKSCKQYQHINFYSLIFDENLKEEKETEKDDEKEAEKDAEKEQE